MKYRLFLVLKLFIGLLCSCVSTQPASDAAEEIELQSIAQFLAQGNIITTISQLESFQYQNTDSEEIALSALWLAYAYYQNLQSEQALAQVNLFLERYPNHQHTDYALFLKAEILSGDSRSWIRSLIAHKDKALLDQSGPNASYTQYQRLIDEFAESTYIDEAKNRLWAIHIDRQRKIMKVAEHNFNRGLWLASGQRAQRLLYEYPLSPFRIKATELLAHSYEKMGLDDLAVLADRIVELNTAKSPAP